MPGSGKQRLAPSVKERMVLRFTSADVRLGDRAGKHEKAAAALIAEPNASDRGLGRRLGMNHHFIATVRRGLERLGTRRSRSKGSTTTITNSHSKRAG
jgi:hypothetical protein